MTKDKTKETTAAEQPPLNRNTFGWLWEFTEGKRGIYLLSIILALLGVVCMLLAYICIAALISELVAGGHDMDFYILRGVQIGILWLLRYIFHGFSTYSSHGATFGLIGNARKRLLKKLNTMPLGAVQTRSSGEYKNVICDRADQVEPTLAHVTPEFTANSGRGQDIPDTRRKGRCVRYSGRASAEKRAVQKYVGKSYLGKKGGGIKCSAH